MSAWGLSWATSWGSAWGFTAGTAVPDVVGETLAYATDLLETAGFTVTVTYAYSESAAGTATDQTPDAGETAEFGSAVAIVISLGPTKTSERTVLVPGSSRDVVVN